MTANPHASRPASVRAKKVHRSDDRETEPETRSYLQPGKLFVGRGQVSVKTVLGSCVAVCIWDGERAVGGMNHYLLPLRTSQANGAARFGEIAIRSLLSELERLGARQAALKARVYGGACVVDSLRKRGAGIGPRNIELAIRMLGALRIPIVSQDVGGRVGRRVVFRVGDGAVWTRYLDEGRKR